MSCGKLGEEVLASDFFLWKVREESQLQILFSGKLGKKIRYGFRSSDFRDESFSFGFSSPESEGTKSGDDLGRLCKKSIVRQHFFVCAIFEEIIFVLTVKHGVIDLSNRIAEIEPLLSQEAEMAKSAMKN